MKLIDAQPIEAALKEIEDRAAAQVNADAKVSYAEARTILDRALAAAANPQFTDVVDVETYAKLQNVSADAVRKRITRPNSKNKPPAEKRGGRWYIKLEGDTAA